MTKIIGINGFKRSGKGEVGNAIAAVTSDHFLNTKQVGFADKLKILAAKTLGFTERSDQECIDLMNECKEEWLISILKRRDEGEIGAVPGNFFPRALEYEWHRITGREYLQNLGNEARGVFGDDFWVDQVLPNPAHVAVPEWREILEDEVATRYPDASYLAITDLRYPNEAQRVLDLGGEVWEVIRPETSSDGHASERPLPRNMVTLQIENKGTLMDLRWAVDKALGL